MPEPPCVVGYLVGTKLTGTVCPSRRSKTGIITYAGCLWSGEKLVVEWITGWRRTLTGEVVNLLSRTHPSLTKFSKNRFVIETVMSAKCVVIPRTVGVTMCTTLISTRNIIAEAT
tara:strand:- start:263 stop:607 length:345 start_codon:yes stop_codon:yes gene_type:complete